MTPLQKVRLLSGRLVVVWQDKTEGETLPDMGAV